jgi:ATP-dependent Zn protease
MGKRDESAQWISMSDMMTGLMLIFLLIAMAFMYEVQQKQKEKNKILVEYNESNLQLYKELKNNFNDKEKSW